MSSVAQTVLPTSVKPAVAAGPIDDAQMRWNRVAFSAGLIGLIFFFGYHDWKISLYDDYAGTSDLMESFTAEGNLFRRIAMIGLGIGSIVILLRDSGFRLQFRNWLAVVMTATAGWCLASLLWSIDPGIAFRRLISTGCIAAAALAAARMLTPRELAASAMLCSAAYLVLGPLTELAWGTFRPWNPDYRLAGTLHPNSQGLNCALLVLTASYLATQLARYRTALWMLAGIGLVGLWMTKSRTPLAALIVAEAAFWIVATSWRNKFIAVLGAIFVACSVILVAGDGIVDRVAQTALLGRTDQEEVGELTGRVPLWEDLSEAIAKRPWQGYGFSSFWISKNIEDVSESQQWAISAAHSTYLDLTLGIGILGVILAVTGALWGLLKAIRLNRMMPTMGFGFIAVLLLFAMVHGLTESAFANPGFVPFVALSGLAMLAFVDPVQYGDLPATEAPQSR